MLMVGLEAVDHELLSGWIDDGTLPNLARLRRAGASAALGSDGEWISEASWQSALTGCGIGSHGAYTWRVVPEGERTRVPLMRGCWRLPFWRVLRENGPDPDAKVALLDVPFPDPARDPAVREIGGWGMRVEKQLWSRPDDLATRLDAARGRPPTWLDREYERNSLVLRRYRRALIGHVRRRTDLALRLLAEDDWTLGLINVIEPHRAGHAFYHGLDPSHPAHHPGRAPVSAAAIRDIHVELDRSVARLAEAAGPDVDLVLFTTFGLRINELPVAMMRGILERLGYLVPAAPGGRTGRLITARRFASTFVPRFARHRLKALVSRGTEVEAAQAAWTSTVDWSRSRVVSEAEPGTAWLRINLAGREPEGIVAPAEREALIDELSQDLMQLVDIETGEPAIEEILRTEERLSGPRSHLLPDLVVIWRPGRRIRALRHPRAGVIRDEGALWIPTEHRGEGMMIAAGPSFEAGARAEGTIHDIAPTALQALGSPIPEQMDGEPLMALFADRGEPRREPIPIDFDPLA
jgi:predicted AlkP superfamily phosphohydrolase/phosphomutase